MKAVITRDFGESSIEEVPRPEPGPGEVLIDVHRIQLSVTECWMWKGELEATEELVDRMRNGDGRVFGHEFCGTIVEVGEGVTDFAVGDRVYAPDKIRCGECPYCEAGTPMLCEETLSVGFEGAPNALSEYCVLPTDPLEVLPEGVSDAEGAAMQPLADALQAVYDADIEAGDAVAVIGAGVMGAQIGQLSAGFGAERVYAVDIAPGKLELAEELGMIPVDATDGDPVEAVREATGGIGADVVFEAVGGDQSHATDGPDPRAQAFRMVRSGGKVVPRGILTNDTLELDPGKMRLKAVTTVFPRSPFGVARTGPNGDLGRLAPAMVADGRVSIDPFVGPELDGLESFEEAIELTLDKEAHESLGPAQMVLE